MVCEADAVEFRPMWTSDKERWCLLATPSDKPVPQYLPATKLGMSALIIEDDEVYAFVVDQMLRAGGEVVGVERGT